MPKTSPCVGRESKKSDRKVRVQARVPGPADDDGTFDEPVPAILPPGARLGDRGEVIFDDIFDWLGLDADDRAIIDLRDELARSIGIARTARGMTQAQLVKKTEMSLPDIARVEKGLPDVNMGQLVEVFMMLGGRFKVEIPSS